MARCGHACPSVITSSNARTRALCIQVYINSPDMRSLGATITSVHVVCGSVVSLYQGEVGPTANRTSGNEVTSTSPVTEVTPTAQPPTHCSYPLNCSTLADFDTLLQATKVCMMWVCYAFARMYPLFRYFLYI